MLSCFTLRFEFRIENFSRRKEIVHICGDLFHDAVAVSREIGQMILKQLKLACRALSRPVWCVGRDELYDLPRKYPRNSFQDPLYKSHSEEYGLREVRNNSINLI